MKKSIRVGDWARLVGGSAYLPVSAVDLDAGTLLISGPQSTLTARVDQVWETVRLGLVATDYTLPEGDRVACPVCGRLGLLVEGGEKCELPGRVIHREWTVTQVEARGWHATELASDTCWLEDTKGAPHA